MIKLTKVNGKESNINKLNNTWNDYNRGKVIKLDTTRIGINMNGIERIKWYEWWNLILQRLKHTIPFDNKYIYDYSSIENKLICYHWKY